MVLWNVIVLSINIGHSIEIYSICFLDSESFDYLFRSSSKKFVASIGFLPFPVRVPSFVQCQS